MYRGFMSCHPTDSYRLFYEVVLRLLDIVRSKDIKIRITVIASSRIKSVGSRHGYAARFRIDYGAWFRIPQL